MIPIDKGPHNSIILLFADGLGWDESDGLVHEQVFLPTEGDAILAQVVVKCLNHLALSLAVHLGIHDVLDGRRGHKRPSNELVTQVSLLELMAQLLG